MRLTFLAYHICHSSLRLLVSRVLCALIRGTRSRMYEMRFFCFCASHFIMLIVNTEVGGSRLNLLVQCTLYLHRDKGETNKNITLTFFLLITVIT